MESQLNSLRGTRKPKLRRLLALQEDLFHRLMLFLPDAIGSADYLESRVGDSPVLRLEILERHPYTTFLRLTYRFVRENQAGQVQHFQPNAHIRIYHDARMAEVTSFEWRQGIQRMAHPELPPDSLLIRGWRVNRALHKWLDYLLAQGHSIDTLKPAGPINARPVDQRETIITN